MTTLGIRKPLHATYDEALARVPEALKSEGFGVLTEIDVRSTLKQKLGVDFRRYKILGACNPPLAHSALQAELDIGIMLPCNVVVRVEGDHVVVEALDPSIMSQLSDGDALAEVTADAAERLTRALRTLKA